MQWSLFGRQASCFKSDRLPHFSSDLSNIWLQCAQQYCPKPVELEFWFSASNFFMVFSCDQAAIWMAHSVCLSVRLSVQLWRLFHYVPIIVSLWNFQELLPWTEVMSMQKVEIRGQRSRSQRSKQILTWIGRFRTLTPVWIHWWLWNDAQSLV